MHKPSAHSPGPRFKKVNAALLSVCPESSSPFFHHPRIPLLVPAMSAVENTGANSPFTPRLRPCLHSRPGDQVFTAQDYKDYHQHRTWCQNCLRRFLSEPEGQFGCIFETEDNICSHCFDSGRECVLVYDLEIDPLIQELIDLAAEHRAGRVFAAAVVEKAWVISEVMRNNKAAKAAAQAAAAEAQRQIELQKLLALRRIADQLKKMNEKDNAAGYKWD
ncbi:hypothetical protein L228DRAFT_264154 [Xylona heveae TC161]|uniref:Uncharacterized protein n=1 Tax=Xylona heveae (strain CBS 132557 / TC161) TaxID=1328760 RepID=A0A164ZFJ3_XYLHT|nr:hypothetical protein L228DRAFT_264154 [Xylona heveae TC161]KZF19038.1 hypothetical protein L228DRAFT_264154 [Xylona heveae TC161]